MFDLVDNLLKHRPIAFLTSADSYLLPNGLRGRGGFSKIGKEDSSKSNGVLQLCEYNGYDEMRLAALLAVTSASPFINCGDRYNSGLPGSGHQTEGIIVGQVGARYEITGVMDWQDTVVAKTQNKESNGYGVSGSSSNLYSKLHGIWAKMWGLKTNFPTYDEADLTSGDYEIFRVDCHLNLTLYKARIRVLADMLLLEAASRANRDGKLAYVHIVGLGLGVWQILSEQESVYVDAWIECLQELPRHTTKLLHTLNFSWIKKKDLSATVSEEGKCFTTGVRVVFSKRNLHDPVPKGCLLICNYAWDSNSAPG